MSEQPGGEDFPTQQLDLTDDAFDDDLEARLETLAPSRIATKATVALAGVVLVVAGFLGGILTQKEFGVASASPTSPANARAGAPGGGFPSGLGRQGNASGAPGGSSRTSGSATTGKVKMVDGTTVYIETSDGRVITVKTTTSTSVETSTKSSLSDLAVGSQVTVEGTAGGTNTITATKVTNSR